MLHLSKKLPDRFFSTYFQTLTLVTLTQFVVFYVVFGTEQKYSVAVVKGSNFVHSDKCLSIFQILTGAPCEAI